MTEPLTTQQHDRLTAAARRALDSLTDLIRDSSDPGTEALGARHELEQALLDDRTQLDANRAYEQRLREQHDHDVAELNRLRATLAATRTKTLVEEADLIVTHCPDHSPQDQDGVWMDCHCDVADDMRRRAAARPAATTQDGQP